MLKAQKEDWSDDAAFDKFLGIVATALESWRLILIPAIVVGLGVSLLFYLEPRMFESTAILRLTDDDLIVLKSSRVFGKGAEEAVEAGLARDTESIAFRAVAVSTTPRNANVQTDTKDSYQVSLTLPSSEGAAKILKGMIDTLLVLTRPDEEEKARLEVRLAELNKARENLVQSLDKLTKLYDVSLSGAGADSSAGGPMDNLGQSSAALSKEITAKTDEIFKTEDSLKGSFTEKDVLQPPTAPKKPLERVTAPFVTLAVALTLAFFLGLALIRAAMTAATNSENMRRIRRAIGSRT